MTAIRVLLFFLPLVLSWSLTAQTTTTATLTHGGLEREYIVYVPAAYDGSEAVPLLLNFHGYTSNAKDQLGYSNFMPVADTANFILVAPQGTKLEGKTHWNVGGWTYKSTVDDVGFTNVLLDSLLADFNVDPTRVYATGMSNGGYMSFLLACQLSPRFAAVASVTGAMTPGMYANCAPEHYTPVLQVHSTSDPVVPFGGAVWSTPIDTVLNYWATFNELSAEPVRTKLEDTDQEDGSTVEHFVYVHPEHDVAVEHYRITNGGHTWPGSPFRAQSGINRDFSATAVIWAFFSRYKLEVL